MSRKLATLRVVSLLRPIPDADQIEVARVDGWECVVKKGEFEVGQLAVYFEVDSWIPNNIAPFLTKPDRGPKEYNGIPGERLRTIKLRKQLSQGLLLPINNWPDLADHLFGCTHLDGETYDDICERIDLTETFGIQKWERALHPSLAGTARGTFPQFIRKTDEERIQNLPKTLERYEGEPFEESIKLDGSSMTAYFFTYGA